MVTRSQLNRLIAHIEGNGFEVEVENYSSNEIHICITEPDGVYTYILCRDDFNVEGFETIEGLYEVVIDVLSDFDIENYVEGHFDPRCNDESEPAIWKKAVRASRKFKKLAKRLQEKGITPSEYNFEINEQDVKILDKALYKLADEYSKSASELKPVDETTAESVLKTAKSVHDLIGRLYKAVDGR